MTSSNTMLRNDDMWIPTCRLASAPYLAFYRYWLLTPCAIYYKITDDECATLTSLRGPKCHAFRAVRANGRDDDIGCNSRLHIILLMMTCRPRKMPSPYPSSITHTLTTECPANEDINISFYFKMTLTQYKFKISLCFSPRCDIWRWSEIALILSVR